MLGTKGLFLQSSKYVSTGGRCMLDKERFQDMKVYEVYLLRPDIA